MTVPDRVLAPNCCIDHTSAKCLMRMERAAGFHCSFDFQHKQIVILLRTTYFDMLISVMALILNSGAPNNHRQALAQVHNSGQAIMGQSSLLRRLRNVQIVRLLRNTYFDVLISVLALIFDLELISLLFVYYTSEGITRLSSPACAQIKQFIRSLLFFDRVWIITTTRHIA